MDWSMLCPHCYLHGYSPLPIQRGDEPGPSNDVERKFRRISFAGIRTSQPNANQPLLAEACCPHTVDPLVMISNQINRLDEKSMSARG